MGPSCGLTIAAGRTLAYTPVRTDNLNPAKPAKSVIRLYKFEGARIETFLIQLISLNYFCWHAFCIISAND